MPNATLTQIQRGWVDQPDSRGTFDIITTCVSGILICLWVMLHLNIPYPNEPWWRITIRKLMYLGVSIVVPELLACMAGGQWAAARRSITAMRAMGNKSWTMTHGFFAETGGFVLEDTQFPPFPVTTSQICYLVKNQYMDMPDITQEEIEDKGKADEVVKVFAIFQAGWVVLEIAGRLGQGLPITLLELETCATVGCSLFTFYFWFYKPMDVKQPTKLHAKISIAKILLRAGDMAKEPYDRTPLDFVECFDTLTGYFGPKERPISRISEDRDVLADTIWILILFESSFFPIHIIQFLGWNFSFPTNTERLLWRWSCIAYTVTLVSYGIVETVAQFFEKEPKTFMQRMDNYKRKWPHQIAFWIPVLIAAVARICILVEVVISMRALPQGCFYNVQWSDYAPHIS